MHSSELTLDLVMTMTVGRRDQIWGGNVAIDRSCATEAPQLLIMKNSAFPLSAHYHVV